MSTSTGAGLITGSCCPAAMPWDFLEIFCHADPKAAVEAVQQHLPLMLQALKAAQGSTADHPCRSPWDGRQVCKRAH
jgi:hypothetical protein